MRHHTQDSNILGYVEPENKKSGISESGHFVAGRGLQTQRLEKLIEQQIKKGKASEEQLSSFTHDQIDENAIKVVKALTELVKNESLIQTFKSWDGNFASDSKEATFYSIFIAQFYNIFASSLTSDQQYHAWNVFDNFVN